MVPALGYITILAEAKQLTEGYQPARVVAGILALLMIAAVIAVVYMRYDLPFRDPSPGKAAAQSYVLEFLAALNANDPQLLGEVTGRPADAPDIKEALRLFGGRDLTDIEIEIVQDFQHHYLVWITARAGDGSVINMYQVVGWEGEHWIMAPLYTGTPPPKRPNTN